MDLDALYGAQHIRVTCSTHQSHTVSPLGYLLLEEVEDAFGSMEHKIEGLVIDFLEEPWLTSLSHRQEEAMGRFDTYTVRCDSRESTEVIASLIQRCPNLNLRVLKIRGDIEAEGWRELAKALRASPKVVRHIDTNKRFALVGGREDLRGIWESLGPRGSWSVLGNGWATFYRQDGKEADERAWKMLMNRING